MMGVTLIELMVVIIVVAILGTLAVNTYRGYLIRTNRTEAQMALLRVRAAQEKFFLQNNRYADNDELTQDPPAGLGVDAITQNTFYTIAIGDYTETTYTATASAQGGQLEDLVACQTLSIDQDGERTPDTGSGCWR